LDAVDQRAFAFWRSHGRGDRLWFWFTSLDVDRRASRNRCGLATFLGTRYLSIVGAPTRLGPDLRTKDGWTDAGFSLRLWLWLWRWLRSTWFDIDTAVPVCWLDATLLEALFLRLVAAKAARRL
jgi:hypothetical protein